MARRPAGITLLIVFFSAAALICAATAFSLSTPGTAVDVMWRIKPAARTDFARLGDRAVALMGAVFALMSAAAVGLWLRRWWGWVAAVAALAIDGLSDGVTSVTTPNHGQLIGVLIAAVLIWYLSRRQVRAFFGLG